MKHHRLEDMVKGWFVGNFDPSVLKTENCEVAIKKYQQGEQEAAHYHKIATEITVIVSGSVRMMGKEWHTGDIITLAPWEITDFVALTDVVTVVVKHPGASHDKYLA